MFLCVVVRGLGFGFAFFVFLFYFPPVFCGVCAFFFIWMELAFYVVGEVFICFLIIFYMHQVFSGTVYGFFVLGVFVLGPALYCFSA